MDRGTIAHVAWFNCVKCVAIYALPTPTAGANRVNLVCREEVTGKNGRLSMMLQSFKIRVVPSSNDVF